MSSNKKTRMNIFSESLVKLLLSKFIFTDTTVLNIVTSITPSIDQFTLDFVEFKEKYEREPHLNRLETNEELLDLFHNTHCKDKYAFNYHNIITEDDEDQ